MLIGATGVGKTQLGIRFLQSGTDAEGSFGAVVDLSSRGDSQNHSGYADRLVGRPLSITQPDDDLPLLATERPADILAFLGYSGRRVMRSQLDVDQWHAWQSDLNRRMPQLYRYIYGHLTLGTKRFLVDGIEPLEDAADSLQLDLLELLYHKMLRKDHDWLAREVLREQFRSLADEVDKRAYDASQAACVVLVTTKQSMLNQLIEMPLADGDLAAAANTVILMGRTQAEGKLGRALYIAKHRGSYADSDILPFEIDDSGVNFPTTL